MPRPEDRSRIEVILLGTLQRRKADYEISKRRFDLVSEHAKDLDLNNPDGATAVRQATKDLNQTLFAYRDAIIDFNRFLLYGTVPDYLRESSPED